MPNLKDPKWDKAKSIYKRVETGTWRALDPIGRYANKAAGKLGSEAFWPTGLDLEIDKAARILRTFTTTGAAVDAQSEKPVDPNDRKKTQKVIKKISPKVLQKAHGLAIFTVFRTGFGWSGAGGSGVVVSRLPDGSWSAPSGLLIHTLGFGFLIGLDIYDVVLVLRNQKAVDAFKKPKISIGGELSVAAGPVGNGAMLDSGGEAAPCWSYVKSKGFYAGIQLDGNIILKRDDENARFYNRPGIKVNDILSGQVSPPQGALPLLQTIYTAEGRPDVMGTDRIPAGPTPGDLELNEDDMRNAQSYAEQDEKARTGDAYGAPAGEAPGESSYTPNATGASTPVRSTSRRMPPVFGAEKTQSGAPAGVAADGVPPPAYDAPSMGDPPTATYDAPPGPPPMHDAPAAGGYGAESAQEEKERLKRQYETADAAAGSSTSAAPSAFPSRMEATFDFTGQESGDLSFKAGDIIDVTGQEDDMWWRGTVNGRSGIFPSNYVKST